MSDLIIRPATPDRWSDIVELFGENGAYSNCWCTWWLYTAGEFDKAAPAARRELLRSEVSDAHEPGIIAYQDGSPVGWCAVGPRQRYGRLNSPRSRTYRRIDDLETWVVNCFFIRKDVRGTGIARALLDAAVDHAAGHGAAVIEGYPRDTRSYPGGAADLFVGTLSMFRAAGFEEAARVGNRPLVRRSLG
jgi:GNAT superfamily N-acetyltransferase